MEAERLGLVRALVENGRGRDPALMAEGLRNLPGQNKPSEVVVPGLLDGLDVIRTRFSAALDGTPGLQAAE